MRSEIKLVFRCAGQPVAAAARRTGRVLTVIGTDGAPDPLAVARLGAGLPAGAPPRPLYLRPADAKPQTGAALARR